MIKRPPTFTPLSQKTRDAKPTPFREMLATIAENGRLFRPYTQTSIGQIQGKRRWP